MSRSLAHAIPQWTEATGMTALRDADDAHSGHWTAYRICRFIEDNQAPALLHVGEGASGCYAVYVTR